METVNCTLTDISGNTTQGQAQMATLSTGERVWRSTKRGGVFWIIAVFCVLIPMLHFVLVPSFLIVGIAMFVKTMREHKLIVSAEGTCPACKQKIHFDGPINASGSKEICSNCRTLVEMKPASLKLV